MAKKRAERAHELYKDPEHQRPQGPGRKRASKLTDIVPVRFRSDVLAEIRRRADAAARSVSAWLGRSTGCAAGAAARQRHLDVLHLGPGGVLDQLTKRGRVAGVQALKEVRTLVDSGFNLFVGSLPCHTTTLQVCGRLALSVRDA